MALVYISLGSNLGDRLQYIRDAISDISNQKIIINKISNIYATEPWGKKDQNEFYNIAVKIETKSNPWQLHKTFKDIESKMKKEILTRWGERTIDIDIIFYDSKIIYEKNLIIPHPRFHLRNFVLIPLCDISEDFIDPVSRKTLKDLKYNVKDECKVSKLQIAL